MGAESEFRNYILLVLLQEYKINSPKAQIKIHCALREKGETSRMKVLCPTHVGLPGVNAGIGSRQRGP